MTIAQIEEARFLPNKGYLPDFFLFLILCHIVFTLSEPLTTVKSLAP